MTSSNEFATWLQAPPSLKSFVHLSESKFPLPKCTRSGAANEAHRAPVAGGCQGLVGAFAAHSSRVSRRQHRLADGWQVRQAEKQVHAR